MSAARNSNGNTLRCDVTTTLPAANAGAWAEISWHFRGLDGLEIDLMLEQLGEQEKQQREPWLGRRHRESDDGEGESGPQERAERA